MTIFLINVTIPGQNRVQDNAHFKKICHSIEIFLTNKNSVNNITDSIHSEEIFSQMIDSQKLIGVYKFF